MQQQHVLSGSGLELGHRLSDRHRAGGFKCSQSSLTGSCRFNDLFSFRWAGSQEGDSLCTFLVAQPVKNPPAMLETRFDPWVGKIPWRREQLPTPVFRPGEFHGLCSPWGHRVGHD